jgi:hypothetical protein
MAVVILETEDGDIRTSKAVPDTAAVKTIPAPLPPTLTRPVPAVIEARNAAAIVLVVSAPVAE